MKLVSLLELASISFITSQQIPLEPITNNHAHCSNLLSRGNGLIPQEQFFTDTNLADYQSLYNCGLNALKKGEFADKRALHDLDAGSDLEDYLAQFSPQDKIGIMGGSDLDRDTSGYREVAFIAKWLSASNYTIITGGGPGAMEAAHLGAWFSCRQDEELNDAIKILATVPKYVRNEWLRTAKEVQNKYPRRSQGNDIAIATFVYGHRPPTSFASKITTYFSEPLREEAILLSSTGALIFTPGGSGTDEEVFSSFKHRDYRGSVYKNRPLILYSHKHWSQQLSHKMISKAIIADSIDDILLHIPTRTGTCNDLLLVD